MINILLNLSNWPKYFFPVRSMELPTVSEAVVTSVDKKSGTKTSFKNSETRDHATLPKVHIFEKETKPSGLTSVQSNETRVTVYVPKVLNGEPVVDAKGNPLMARYVWTIKLEATLADREAATAEQHFDMLGIGLSRILAVVQSSEVAVDVEVVSGSPSLTDFASGYMTAIPNATLVASI